MTNPPALVVFSDLDGTLLDHDSYAWLPAKPALDRLSDLGCPVILSSSKTAAEIVVLQNEMGLAHLPAIVENGAGVIGLEDGTPQAADAYATLRRSLESQPPSLRTRFRGFGDMTMQELAHLTGLTETAARLAQKRMFSEPGMWTGTDAEKAEFAAALAKFGLIAQQGGRFLTLSHGGTKADGMRRVLDHFGSAISVALGDAPNDVAMLDAADHGIIVANPHRPPLPPLQGEADGRITRTAEPGPTGWNTAMHALLDTLDLPTGTHAHG